MAFSMTFSVLGSAFIGGVLLGLSATLLLLFNGKIAGISGIAAGLLNPANWFKSWQLLFVIGMLMGGYLLTKNSEFSFPSQFGSSSWQLIIAGLLVGFGTRLGNGCTSGHGICGIGRLSTRSIVATLIFMAAAMLTVFVRIHL